MLAQQLATRPNREHAVVQRIPVLITLHVPNEDCDPKATGYFANVLQPGVRLGGNPVGANDLGKGVSRRGELGRDNPLRTRFRGDCNPFLHEPLVVREVSGPRSKMEKCDAEWIHQHRWLSSMLVLAAVSSNAVDMMRQLRVSDDDKDDRHN
jgi:hypothetical protein